MWRHLLDWMFKDSYSSAFFSSGVDISSSSSSSIDPEKLKEFLITCYVVAGLYFIPLIAAFCQLVKFLRVRYLPPFVLHKAYALLLVVAALRLCSSFAYIHMFFSAHAFLFFICARV